MQEQGDRRKGFGCSQPVAAASAAGACRRQLGSMQTGAAGASLFIFIVPCGSDVLRAVLRHQHVDRRIGRREALPHLSAAAAAAAAAAALARA